MVDHLNLALSVHAPWAWALMFAGKGVENRNKNFPRRRDGEPVLGRVWVGEETAPFYWKEKNITEACFLLLGVGMASPTLEELTQDANAMLQRYKQLIEKSRESIWEKMREAY